MRTANWTIKSKRQKNKLNDNRRRYIFLFLKTFLITSFSLISLIVAVGGISFYGTIRPPDIPTIPTTSENEIFAASLAHNSHIPIEEGENTPIGSGLIAPEGFTAEDRRDLFFTFLIVGLNEGTNANTIMVASYDGINKEANLVSIPRDSLINVNRGVRKLSGAYMTGTLRGGGVAGGVAQMQREVMSIIGFVPDFYVIINYDAFHAIIDAVGGIEIDVPFHMRYDDPFQNLHIDIPPGTQLMDGETALHFARFRNSNRGFRAINDYQRIENQQTVVNATLASLLRPANILRIPEFIDIFNENVHTNLTLGNMLWFASQLNEVRGSDVLSTYTAPTTGTSGAPMWYELLDGPGIVELVNRTINPYEIDIGLWDLNIISR